MTIVLDVECTECYEEAEYVEDQFPGGSIQWRVYCENCGHTDSDSA